MFRKLFVSPALALLPLLVLGVLGASLSGCATSPGQMSAKQKEAAELRAFCLRNPDDVVTCLGFLGDR